MAFSFGTSQNQPAAGGASLFGASTAGANPGASLFGGGGSLFQPTASQQNAQPAAGSLFGGSFGASTTAAPAAPSLFGASTAAAPAPSVFGAAQPATQPGTALSLFGSSTTAAAQPAQAPAVGLFGAPAPTTSSVPAGGLFGSAAPSVASQPAQMFQSVQQQQYAAQLQQQALLRWCKRGASFAGIKLTNAGQNLNQSAKQHWTSNSKRLWRHGIPVQRIRDTNFSLVPGYSSGRKERA